MAQTADERELLDRVLEIYDQKQVAAFLNSVTPERWTRETVNRWFKGKASPRLSSAEYKALKDLLPKRSSKPHEFDFIDLFAGIGGLRRAFESIGGRCVLTSEWNKEAVRTYKANYDCDPGHHVFNQDIRDLTLTHREDVSEKEADKHILKVVPKHDVLLAGFRASHFQ